MIRAANQRSVHRRGSVLQGKVQSFQHHWHFLVNHHHSWKVLTNHKSHAHWPFLTKIFMHSYDLTKATSKNKGKIMRRKEWPTKPFKITTKSHSCSSPVSSKHSLLLTPRLYFPMMTCHHYVQQARFTLEVFQVNCWVCCLSCGFCAIACLFWAEKTRLITSSQISEKHKSGMIAPFPATVCSSIRGAAMSFPQRESEIESSYKVLDLPW